MSTPLPPEGGYMTTTLSSDGGQLWGEDASHVMHHTTSIPPTSNLVSTLTSKGLTSTILMLFVLNNVTTINIEKI